MEPQQLRWSGAGQGAVPGSYKRQARKRRASADARGPARSSPRQPRAKNRERENGATGGRGAGSLRWTGAALRGSRRPCRALTA